MEVETDGPVVTVDPARERAVIIRILRLGQRHDRVVLTIDQAFIGVILQQEGDSIGASGRYVGTMPLPEP